MSTRVHLYEPERFRVSLGTGSSIALCTAWNHPEQAFQRSAIVRERTAIVGSLYSRYGVNVMIRNLALNPHIRTLILWDQGPLSQTAYGRAGTDVVRGLWNPETRAQTAELLEPVIDRSVLDTITQHVELVTASSASFTDVEALLQAHDEASTTYMDPVAFPAPPKQENAPFPSERVGWAVHGRTVLDAWTRVASHILRYGTIKGTQYGVRQRELLGMQWVIRDERPSSPDLSLGADWPLELLQTIGATPAAIAEYQSSFLDPIPKPNLSYTYGSRLQSYPVQDGVLDQVEAALIGQLAASPSSRRAVATTLIPSTDAYSHEPPCLVLVQAFINDGHVDLFATFRSHDVFKAGIPNAFGLRALQARIAERLSCTLGALSIHSQSAHIYEQDWEDGFKLMKCVTWERDPSLVFDAATQADPRGVAIVRLHDKAIRIEFQTADGEVLYSYESPSAKALAARIAHLHLLQRHDHALDVGMELQKAEIALRLGIVYEQDRPLRFEL